MKEQSVAASHEQRLQPHCTGATNHIGWQSLPNVGLLSTCNKSLRPLGPETITATGKSARRRIAPIQNLSLSPLVRVCAGSSEAVHIESGKPDVLGSGSTVEVRYSKMSGTWLSATSPPQIPTLIHFAREEECVTECHPTCTVLAGSTRVLPGGTRD